MLSDVDLERALQRYRVADPPRGLASVVVAATVDAPGRFEWLWAPAAAAAVFASWVAFHLAMAESPRDPIRDEEVAFVTQVLGGDENAAAYAESVVPQSPKQDVQMALVGEDPWQEN